MGTLALDDSQSFAGTIAGFGAENQIDLGDIGFSTNSTLAYTPNNGNTGGELVVSDGTYTANLALLGQYSAANFAVAGDGHGGTLLTEPSVAQTMLTVPHA